MSTRQQQCQNFLATNGWDTAEQLPIKGDASFRHYTRLNKEGETAMLMDAPPEKEAVAPFIQITEFLRSQSLNAPEILAEDQENGFLLLEDLGNDSYTNILQEDQTVDKECELYMAAVDVLSSLRKEPLLQGLPQYNNLTLLNESLLFVDWYLKAILDAPLEESKRKEFCDILEAVFPLTRIEAPVVILRDFHADNLMWLPERKGVERVGLLDYQDALIGSPAYDLVSLLEDARRDVSTKTVFKVLEYYLSENPDIHVDSFKTSYAILGAQRNLKIIGIFSRLAIRDNKPHYLSYLPRVWGHLDHDLTHPALDELKDWLEEIIPPDARGDSLTWDKEKGICVNA